MSDETQAASQEPAAPDLDSILDKAIETHTPKDEPVAAAPESAEQPSEPKAEHPTDPTRYADGTFKPTKTYSAAEASEKSEPAETAKPAEAKAPDPVAGQPIEPPARLTADERAVFAKWPRDVQQSYVDRYKAMEADYTRKTQEAAELRRTAEPVLNAVKPYEQYLSQLAPRIGKSPDQMIGALLGAEYQLRTGEPWQKVQALQQIAAEYGIDLAAMNRGEMPAAPDPHYQQLRQSFGSLEQRVAQYERLIEQEQQRQAVSQLEEFATAKDESGRLRHPHFERVKSAMGHIIGSDPSLSLDAAYQKAIEPIQQAVAEELRTRTEAAERERQAAIEKAKKVAPIKSSGSQPNGATKAKDLDSLLSEAIASRGLS